jgi:hypothetical protein
MIANNRTLHPAGIRFIRNAGAMGARRNFFAKIEGLGLHRCIAMTEEGGDLTFSLRDELADAWAPQSDTTQLSRALNLNPIADAQDREREILLAMLASPRPFEYPSYNEFDAAVRIRINIVAAARSTQLAFHAAKAERPADYWTYDEELGFAVLSGKSLIKALEKATQPDSSGTLYSLSCYRATEYVILLGIAQELETLNPPLLERLQIQWETQAIKSGSFDEVFLYESGSIQEPLPPAYYVPGDRVWFRNPDRFSSDVPGYEGSWVFYLGGGLFSNFWKRNQPYTLTRKCLEIFHWRHGVYCDDTHALQIDDSVVDSHVRSSFDDPEKREQILALMQRLRDPTGVYAHGGCLDASREFPRWVCPGTANIVLPNG